MTTDPTTAHDDAFLAIMYHVIFEMTPEQAAALMADDELTRDSDTTHGPPTVATWPRT